MELYLDTKDESRWVSQPRMGSNVSDEQSGAYHTTTTRMRMKIAAATAALRWISKVSVTILSPTYGLCCGRQRMGVME